MRWIVALGCGAALLWPGWSALAEPLAPGAMTMLGNRAGKLVAVDEEAGGVLYVADLESGELKKLSDDIAVREVKLSPDGTRVAYRQNLDIFVRALDGSQPTKLTSGYSPRWWIEPGGAEWLYYSDRFATTIWPDQGNGLATLRRRLSDNFEEKVLDWKTYSGPSLDGTHLGSDYITVIMFDEQKNAHVVNGGQRGCYSSMSPDNRYWLMHLDFDHNRILVHDQGDVLRWFMPMPPDTNYVNWSTWSNDPDVITFSARESNRSFSLYAVRFSDIDGQTGQVKPGALGPVRILDARTGGHSWATSNLWLMPKNEPRNAGVDAPVGGDSPSRQDGGRGCRISSAPSSSASGPLAGCLMLALRINCLSPLPGSPPARSWTTPSTIKIPRSMWTGLPRHRSRHHRSRLSVAELPRTSPSPSRGIQPKRRSTSVLS